GRCIAGFFSRRSHRPVESDACKLQPPFFSDIAKDVIAFANENEISPYQEDTRTGLLRHIYLRHAEATGEIMVCLVINAEQFPHADQLVSRLIKRYPGIMSIVLNINTENTNVILGKRCVTLYGSETITDELRGVKVQLSALSFYQVNRQGAARLYDIVEEEACPDGVRLLLDMYCGAGTIGLSMANRADRLIGVDSVAQAIENAEQNAVLNGFDNCEFLCADASQAAAELSARGLRPDAVILDPPRKGCDYECLRAVAQMQPARIVMISCNPATAARDMKTMQQEFGYMAVKATAVDMFPRTGHVECVVLMSRNI
ncbi:MAG: 23S rRNA (uracil(1939)-C(5))-methyltransferase RlmD, partial [Acetanaerobacterium sp.]